MHTYTCIHTFTHTHTHTHTTLVLEQIVCPILTILNGVVDTSLPGQVFNSRTIYTCDTDSISRSNLSYPAFSIPQYIPKASPGHHTFIVHMHTYTCIHTFTHIHYFVVEQIVCPVLTISNGVVDTSPPGQVFNSRTTYTCDPGYTLRGDSNRVCQEDGTWNGTDPECGK